MKLGHKYKSNLSKTTLIIIFQHQLVMVVVPKPCNFGKSVQIEINQSHHSTLNYGTIQALNGINNIQLQKL